MCPKTMYETLKTVFGFRSFRPNQEKIIGSILNHRDVFAVMPTGGGKSLCYQLPARLLPGTVVVISPLISLMKDQVDAARSSGIAAAYLNSSLKSGESAEVKRRLCNGLLELLYVAPERFAMPYFVEMLQQIQISVFAIDEAHCISEWGHDFRPDYLNLGQLSSYFPQACLAAFTATATTRVQEDIIQRTGLRNPFIVRASFDRDNLFYQVDRKQNAQSQVLSFLAKHRNESGIIYRTTRESVEETAKFLKTKGFKSLPYHAGLSAEERQQNQEAFNNDEINIIVATIAFGMGIDKSNVRFVVHMDLPKNIESYYQETGRAGRDGEPSHCRFLFSMADIHKIRYFIKQISDEREQMIAQEKLNQMVKYATHNVCRRKQLLQYFGESYPHDNCGSCDICVGDIEKVDATTDAQILLSAMVRTNQRFGIKHIVDIVVGSKVKRIQELGHDKIKTYGAGKHKDRQYWSFLIDELLMQEIIVHEGERYPILRITPKGMAVLYQNGKVTILQRQEIKRKKTVSEEYDEDLFEQLRALRKRLADERAIAPFIVFSDKTLHEMCRHYPQNMEQMQNISGIGAIKLKQYGQDFLEVIKNYLEQFPQKVKVLPRARATPIIRGQRRYRTGNQRPLRGPG